MIIMWKTTLFQVDCNHPLLRPYNSYFNSFGIPDKHIFCFCSTSHSPFILPSLPHVCLQKIWNRNLGTIFWAQIVISPLPESQVYFPWLWYISNFCAVNVLTFKTDLRSLISIILCWFCLSDTSSLLHCI